MHDYRAEQIPSVSLTSNTVKELHLSGHAELDSRVLESDHPLLLRGLITGWPVVEDNAQGSENVLAEIAKYYHNKPVSLFLGEENINGRFFYNEDLSGFNFLQMQANLLDVFEKLIEFKDQRQAPAFYVGSTSVDHWLPGFRQDNDLGLDHLNPLFSIWIGNRSRVAAHFDFPHNIACCVAGKRRFTLFPPDQLPNLYVGPQDLTPAGQQISLVDFSAPDYEKFPAFEDAVKKALVADLNPGDALFVPGMWWHHVEALSAINVLANYWWTPSPAYLGSPSDALTHAMLAIKSLSPEQRAAWERMFQHYVFEANEDNIQHIPEMARGRLGAIDEIVARRLRAELLNKLKQ